MSEAATRERAFRQHRAVPGGARDRLLGAAKIALPSAVGVLIAFLALAPLGKDDEISFILDKNKVENAPERMRVESARYTGQDNRGQKFELTASSALQQSSDVPLVDIRGMIARMGLARGPVVIRADGGRYNLDSSQVAVPGRVQVAGRQGEDLATGNVLVDLKRRTISSNGPVAGRMPVGTFQARQLRADIGERNVVLDGGVSGQVRLGRFQAGRMQADLDTRVLVLDQGVRLKIVQGAVR